MRNVMRWVLAGAAACALAAASVASACDYSGYVVCKGTTQGVKDVAVWIDYADAPWDVQVTDTSGFFSGRVGGTESWYGVTLDVNGALIPEPDWYCNASGDPVFLGTYEVALPGCTPPPPPPPPPPGCVAPTGMLTGAYCPARPIGNPDKECGLLGLAPLTKDDFGQGSSTFASTGAAAVLVKSGGCYNIYANVVKGQLLVPVADSGAISHVTYCTCK